METIVVSLRSMFFHSWQCSSQGLGVYWNPRRDESESSITALNVAAVGLVDFPLSAGIRRLVCYGRLDTSAGSERSPEDYKPHTLSAETRLKASQTPGRI